MTAADPDPVGLVFGGLDKPAPGSDEATRRALDALPPADVQTAVDAGCGTGRHTSVLAERLGVPVHALDTHRPSLDRIGERAEAAGLGDLVRPRALDVAEIADAFEDVDLVWSEGAAYTVGAPRAFEAWRPALADGGFVVFSELTWLTDNAPDPARSFFATAEPDIQTVAQNRAVAEAAGYRVLGDFVLLPESWADGYDDDALSPRVEALADPPTRPSVTSRRAWPRRSACSGRRGGATPTCSPSSSGRDPPGHPRPTPMTAPLARRLLASAALLAWAGCATPEPPEGPRPEGPTRETSPPFEDTWWRLAVCTHGAGGATVLGGGGAARPPARPARRGRQGHERGRRPLHGRAPPGRGRGPSARRGPRLRDGHGRPLRRRPRPRRPRPHGRCRPVARRAGPPCPGPMTAPARAPRSGTPRRRRLHPGPRAQPATPSRLHRYNAAPMLRSLIVCAAVALAAPPALAQGWGESIVFGTTVPVPFDMMWSMGQGAFDRAAGEPCGIPNESDLEDAIIQAYEDAGQCDDYDPDLYDAYSDWWRNTPDDIRRSTRRSFDGFFAYHSITLGRAPLGSAPLRAGAPDHERTTFSPTAFVPDPARRSEIARSFADRVAAQSGSPMPSGDALFEAMAGALAGAGLSTDDLADAVAVYLVGLWEAATGERVDVTPTLAAAVAAQARAALLAADGVPGDVQGRSDELLLQAWLVASLDATYRTRDDVADFREAMRRAGREAFGLDLAALTLTDEGFGLRR